MRLRLCSAVLATLALGSPSSFAGPILDRTLGTCTPINCSSLSLTGSIIGYGSNNAAAWIEHIYVGQGQCLRLQVTAQAFDLEMTVVAPNGLVYRNDNAGASLLPLVKINNAPVAGYYGVTVSTASGSAGGHDFDLLHGRYVSGNPNCVPRTRPF